MCGKLSIRKRSVLGIRKASRLQQDKRVPTIIPLYYIKESNCVISKAYALQECEEYSTMYAAQVRSAVTQTTRTNGKLRSLIG